MAQVANGQTAFTFDKSMGSGSCHRYGRDALYTDTLAHLLYSGRLKPVAEATWYNEGGITKKWTAVQADSTGTYRGREMNNGYLYLSCQVAKAQPAILTISGHSMAYLNGEAHAGDQYRYGWMHVPVMLKKGLNELYIRTGFTGRNGGVQVKLIPAAKPLQFGRQDATLPFLVKGMSKDSLLAGIVCLNAGNTAAKSLTVEATTAGKTMRTPLPLLHSLGTRKMPINLPVPTSFSTGTVSYQLRLTDGRQTLDTMTLVLNAVEAHQHQSHTFLSNIDGSVQYYAVAPQLGGPTANPSLFFSVHGAEVEAISQARAYKPKADGPVVAPTNRRPRGFNWEDWGRLDALEVLDIAKTQYKPNARKIYLTGHSMGGHGTWFLGATYAGQWASIAPCAGYPVLQGYGSADGLIPTEAGSPVRAMLLRASNPSNVLQIAQNYKAAGVYIHHGDDDQTVSVNYARQMRKVLSEFHPDFAYYEYPGGSHWFGDISVDWPPLFDFFKHHTRAEKNDVINIDFSTANPAISATHHAITIAQQEKSFAYSRVKLKIDTAKNSISGTTENVASLTINSAALPVETEIPLQLDGQKLTLRAPKPDHNWNFNKVNGTWQQGQVPDATEKGTQRGAGFKEAFKYNMLFVYGTKGTPEENAWALQKARYDAESWYYRGTGALDVIPDTEFNDLLATSGRGVVLYGNATTNAAYDKLLKNCPVRIERNKATVGGKTFTGDNTGGYFVFPIQGLHFASVAVIGGTGLPGMRAADANQYFAGGSGFPDFMLFDASLPLQGEKAMKAAGYYNNKFELGTDWVTL
ncbi:MAG: alpha/beta hydrolase [Bacteroidetes bacterium]|nr:MAG: alpha/beta hydrolase [Bacteroidota bacterium]